MSSREGVDCQVHTVNLVFFSIVRNAGNIDKLLFSVKSRLHSAKNLFGLGGFCCEFAPSTPRQRQWGAQSA